MSTPDDFTGSGGIEVRLRARRIERAGSSQSRDADLPLDLGVVRLEIGVRDRPVGEPRAWDRAEHAALVEVDFVEAPEVRRVVQARAADATSVHHRAGLNFCSSAFLSGASRNVCGFFTTSFVMPPRYQSFNSSCLKDRTENRGPCSISTTVSPACAASGQSRRPQRLTR